MSVFKLQSNKQFIGTGKDCPDILVREYTGDSHDFEMVRCDLEGWSPPTAVGPSAEATFKALEVFDVTIEGDQLKELLDDLRISCRNDEELHLVVNRQGLCFVSVNTVNRDKWLRINDHFGWSKYGVVPQISSDDIWSIRDMSNGDVLMGPPIVDQSSKDDDDEAKSSVWKKLLKEKEKVMEMTESLLRKSIEEKEQEAVSIKAALKALTGAN